MSSKTKIVVLHLKELIYTCIFAVLGILFLILLLIMFLPGKSSTPESMDGEGGIYTPGKYTTSLILGSSAVDVEVVVDDNNINSIRLVNLDEAVTTMYPLMEPALNDLASQICAKQSMEDISYPDDNKYTAQVLLEAISSALATAERNPSDTGRSKTRLTQEKEAEKETGEPESLSPSQEAQPKLQPLDNTSAKDPQTPPEDGTDTEKTSSSGNGDPSGGTGSQEDGKPADDVPSSDSPKTAAAENP